MKIPKWKGPPGGEEDPKHYAVEAVAVQAQGFVYCAPVVRTKDTTWVWLTGEQQGHILRCVPRDREYIFDDRHLSLIRSRYPRHFLGYVASACGRPAAGIGSGEDRLVDANALLDACAHVSEHAQWTMGANGILALLRVALGRPATPEVKAAVL